jgi:hypothetical protein
MPVGSAAISVEMSVTVRNYALEKIALKPNTTDIWRGCVFSANVRRLLTIISD